MYLLYCIVFMMMMMMIVCTSEYVGKCKLSCEGNSYLQRRNSPRIVRVFFNEYLRVEVRMETTVIFVFVCFSVFIFFVVVAFFCESFLLYIYVCVFVIRDITYEMETT
uniref:Uncharacterized protein n=1 Tax=Trichobilharzia regenti TaxID=157069 RepID=A0AA85JPQ3_TRIRE|nr:unnamed protein product [Trichobilharzia regenti]